MLGFTLYFTGVLISGLFFLAWYEIYGYLMLGSVAIMLFGNSEVFGYWALSFGMGFDLLGWALVLLSVWVGALMIMASVRGAGAEYLGLLVLMIFFLFFTFSVMDYLWFYVFFESSLIPILLVILGWGYQPERLQAGIYMLFYTLFGSLPLLVSFLCFMGTFGSTSYEVLWWFVDGGISWYLFSIFAFLIKMPMFLVHLWLPSAHVEAPVAGSMMLAGVLLSLGGYGLLRILWFFLSVGVGCSFIFISLGVLGAFVVSLICLRQYDLSALIAYSSVSHMGLVLGGVFSVNGWGWQGALVLMLGHGLCSSGLFCLANMVYERLGSRSLLVSSGLLMVFPGMCLWWFMLGVCNMAAPPSINLLGEIMLFVGVLGWCFALMLVLIGASFFSAVYTLYMYSITQHGSLGVYYGFSDCSIREFELMLLHWAPLNFFILSSDLVYLWC